MGFDTGTRLPASFNRLAWANLAAQSGEQIALAAAAIVAVLVLDAGAGETALLQTVLTLPFLVLAIPAGVLADRMSRKRLMTAAEILRVGALLLILTLLNFGLLTWPLLAALGFVAVCGTVVFSVAAPALVPTLVPDNALASANARIELARTTAFAAGPAVGGALVGWVGAFAAFGAAAVLSAMAAALLSALAEPARRMPQRRRVLQEIREGTAFVFTHPLLRPVFATQFVFSTAFFLVLAIFVPHAVHNLGLSATGVGVCLGMYGIGMMVGALLAPRIMAMVAFGSVIAIGPCIGVVASVLMALTIWYAEALLAGASLFLLGAGPIVWVISTMTLRQTVTPQDFLGRVSAINIMSYGARPIGAGLGAVIGSVFGIEACLLTAVAFFALQALIIIVSPVVRLERQPKRSEEQRA